METHQEPAPTATQRKPPKIFYGWYIVAGGTIGSFLNLAIFAVGPGIFVKDIQADLNWSLAAISLAFSIKQFEQGLSAPVAGYLLDRFGPRLMGTIGVIVMSLGLLLFSQVRSLWMLYLAATIIAIGQGTGSGGAFSMAVMYWFVKKRGRAYSFLAMGRAWGYIGVLGITWVLVTFGWRWACAINAIVYLAINLPLAQTIRLRPQPYGYLPDGDPSPETTQQVEPSKPNTGEDTGFSVNQALRSPTFWLVAVAVAFYGFANNINLVHQTTALRSAGLSPTRAATVVAIFGGIQVIGRLIAGWLGDKIGRARLLMLSFPLLGIGWLFFANIGPGRFWIIFPYLITYAMGQSAHTAMDQVVVADFFGTRRYATIRGLITPLSLVGSVMGPLFAGVMFDRFGSFQYTFLTLAPIVALGAPVIFLASKLHSRHSSTEAVAEATTH